MVADKQMFTGAQISSVNIVTAARCGWISRGRRRGKYKRVDKDGYKDMFVGNILAKNVIQRAWWCRNTRDLEGKRCPNSSRGQRKRKQASMRNAERQKKDDCYQSGQQASSAHTLALFSIITHNTNQITLGCRGT